MAQTTREQHTPPTTRLTGGTLFLLAGLAALGALATNIILPAFPDIGRQMAANPQELALTLSSFFVTFAIGQLFVGPLSDRFGRQRLVMGGLVVFVVGSLLCAWASSLTLLIVGRMIQALGACAASVLARAIARDLFDGEELARALALIMMAMAAAPGFSPLLGSALNGALGWQSTFVVVAICAVVLGLIYLRRTGETLPPSERSNLALVEVMSAYRKLAINPLFIFPALAVSLVIGGLYTFFATAPAILMKDMGLSALELGLFFAATVFVVFGAGILAPRLAHRWGPRLTGMAGAFVTLVGSVLILSADTGAFVFFTLALAVFLLGMGLANPMGTAIALQPFGHQAGLASSLLGFLQMSCAAIGSLLVSQLPLEPVMALGSVLTTGSLIATLAFIPVLLPATGRVQSTGSPS